ncbi:Dabb family protein [Conexibacter sp. CPCC 206217]|uniref:Dabb family protein n=1 Tax=Conexibacter sp. CPCC 206217 TaxID=3064574 RepID=UPI00271ADE16|nr:Dabb family protein [Conexibacter sp. CPCC 206217]MDO8208912.1 Dabb family protein [Conexibacter sp. CPCC 206217]
MIKHFLLFNAPPQLSQESLAELLLAARHLPQGIEEPRNFQIGAAFAAVTEPRWRFCMSMEFEDEAALQRYTDHPLHLAFRDLLRERIEDRQVQTVRCCDSAEELCALARAAQHEAV